MCVNQSVQSISRDFIGSSYKVGASRAPFDQTSGNWLYIRLSLNNKGEAEAKMIADSAIFFPNIKKI